MIVQGAEDPNFEGPNFSPLGGRETLFTCSFVGHTNDKILGESLRSCT